MKLNYVGKTLRAKEPASETGVVRFYQKPGTGSALISITIDGIRLECELTPDQAGVLGTEMIRWTGWLRAMQALREEAK